MVGSLPWTGQTWSCAKRSGAEDMIQAASASGWYGVKRSHSWLRSFSWGSQTAANKRVGEALGD